jgi:hypothetical protein
VGDVTWSSVGPAFIGQAVGLFALTGSTRARPTPTARRSRSVIERVIAHFTTWRIMHTDYRRPPNTFATTISAVVGLYFYLLA